MNIHALQQELEKTQKQLQELREEYAQYAYIVSHDLRAPMRQMASFAELLHMRNKDTLDEDSLRFLDHILKSATKGQKLIEVLLDYSRIQTSDAPRGKLALSTCLNDACDQLREQHVMPDNATIESTALPTLQGNASQLTRLCFELCRNALTYQPEGNAPKVQIDCESDAAQHTLLFTDNGTGIPAAQHTKIFKPLQRAGKHDDIDGYGMGLCFADAIARAHGGSVSLRDSNESGSTFAVTLPITAQTNAD